MRVGINATCLNDRPSGARQRFAGLFSRLMRLMPETEFVMFEPEDCRVSEWFPGTPNLVARRTPLHSERRVQRLLRGLTYWPGALSSERFDLFEALHMPVVRPGSGKTLLTIHDVRGLHPGQGWMGRVIFRKVLKASLERADHVVTVSEAMRAEILAFDNHTPISVLYNGLDLSRLEEIDPGACEAVLPRFHLPDRFLLAVGHFEPRKNYPKLIEAFGQLHRGGAAIALVIVGNDSGERARIDTQIQAAGLQSTVHLLSGISDIELRCLYSAASALVFPSRYEGFGIPLLEAMASGLPVVASDIPVFREILGNAGAYFDPDSSTAMAAAIASVQGNPAVREQMTVAGSARVRHFDYDVLALEMASLYGRIMAGASQ